MFRACAKLTATLLLLSPSYPLCDSTHTLLRRHLYCIAGLMSLKTAVVGGPLNLTTAINSSWSNATTMSPCHDIDPNCQLCPWALPSLCGTQLPSVVGGPPSFYCNVVAVSCRDGRVTNISLDSSGLVLSSLPAGFSQLPWLQQLGEYK